MTHHTNGTSHTALDQRTTPKCTRCNLVPQPLPGEQWGVWTAVGCLAPCNNTEDVPRSGWVGALTTLNSTHSSITGMRHEPEPNGVLGSSGPVAGAVLAPGASCCVKVLQSVPKIHRSWRVGQCQKYTGIVIGSGKRLAAVHRSRAQRLAALATTAHSNQPASRQQQEDAYHGWLECNSRA